MSRIRPPEKNTGKIIAPPDSVNMENFKYPVFCFKHLHNKYNLSHCNTELKGGLIDKLYQMSQMTWDDLINTNRHKSGSEKIFLTSIKAEVPKFITDDVKFLLAFRFHNMLPFLGHRNRFLFHIIFIDHSRNLYNHG